MLTGGMGAAISSPNSQNSSNAARFFITRGMARQKFRGLQSCDDEVDCFCPTGLLPDETDWCVHPFSHVSFGIQVRLSVHYWCG
jgi:hypothetical protein